MSTEYWILSLTFVGLILCVGVFGVILSSQWKKHRRSGQKANTPPEIDS